MHKIGKTIPVGEGVTALCLEVSSETVVDFLSSYEAERYSYVYCFAPDGTLRAQTLFHGSARSLRFGKDAADFGAFPGEISPGTWEIILLTASPTDAPVVKLTPTHSIPAAPCAKKSSPSSDVAGWLRGDFHAHSLLSDGLIPPEQIEETVRACGLDFLFLTDHNMVASGFAGGVYAGCELTDTLGHLNLLSPDAAGWGEFVQQHFSEGTAHPTARFGDWLTTLGDCTAVLNHPFMAPYDFSDRSLRLAQLAAMEIICDPTWVNGEPSAEEALSFLWFLNASGCRLTGVGGSDAHLPLGECYDGAALPSRYGEPTSFVYARNSRQEILEAVRRGHVYVTRRHAISLRMNEGKLLPGDSAAPNSSVCISLQNDTAEDFSVIEVRNGQRGARRTVKGQSLLLFSLRTGHTYEAIGLEIRGMDGSLQGFVNAIYVGEETCPYHTVWEAMEGYQAEREVARDAG